MNKNIEEKASKILDLMISGVEDGVELAKTEMPQLLNEYMHYLFIKNIPLVALSLAALSAVTIIVNYWLAARAIKKNHEPSIYCVIIAFSAALLIPCLMSALSDAKRLYALKHAPKAYLIEEIRGKHRELF